MTERDRDFGHEWHVAVNAHAQACREGGQEWPRFMYEAMDARHEVPRLTAIIGMERRGELTRTHQQCSLTPVEPVADNHLSCCLGVECRKCPHLLALDSAKLTPEQIDEAKAWTCVSHILMSGGDTANEGFLLTVDDRMFWDNTHESMARGERGEIGMPRGGRAGRGGSMMGGPSCLLPPRAARGFRSWTIASR